MGLSAFAYNYDPRRPLVDANSGVPIRDGRDFLLALFNRGGGAAGVPNVQVGVVASGSAQTDAFGLIGDWNYVETVVSGTGVVIPPIEVGSDCIVFNAGANTLKIYPSVVAPAQGGPVQIDALGANNPYPLAAGKMQWFRMVKPSLLKSMQLG
jgi:hypothetical protein